MQPTAKILDALEAVRNELDSWGDFEQSESWREYFPEAIDNDQISGREPHPLWLAVMALQRFYPKNRLPKLTGALDAWADLCKYSRQKERGGRITQRNKAVEAAAKLRQWVCDEEARIKAEMGSPTGNLKKDEGADETGLKTASTKRGRTPHTDPKKDKQLYEAWRTGQYKKFAELDAAMKLDEGEAKRAVDRHRHRQKPTE